MKRHKVAQSTPAAKPARSAAANAAASETAAAVPAAAAVSSAGKPKKEKKQKVYGNGVHEAVAGGPGPGSSAGATPPL